MLDDYRIIIAYDESSDNTLQELHLLRKTFPEGKMTIIMGDNKLSYIRTQNIANARNRILNSIREDKENMFEYFIMMDMDEVCSGKMNKKLLRRFLKSDNDLPWDALTFNRSVYYDVWALSINPYTFSCWHYANHKQIYTNMVHYVNKQLADVAIHDSRNALLPCISAFNGFGLYRTAKFICSKYEWNVHATLAIYPKSEIDIMSRQVLSQPIARHDDCEHRYFHIRASQLNGARICISPNCLFS
jgi:glycosyltransferase involved in cell wall biosynthesis